MILGAIGHRMPLEPRRKPVRGDFEFLHADLAKRVIHSKMKHEDEPMKLSELDKMLQERRDLAALRSVLRAGDCTLSADTDDWTNATVPKSITFGAVNSLLDSSMAKLMEIDGRLVEWGVEIDMPHETEQHERTSPCLTPLH